MFCQVHNVSDSVPILSNSLNDKIHEYNTRGSKKMHAIQARTNKMSDSFIVKDPVYWNRLPKNVTNLTELCGFTHMLKNVIVLIHINEMITSFSGKN